MANNSAESILTEAQEQRFIIEDFRPLTESPNGTLASAIYGNGAAKPS
jgi:hypothetical protein